MAESDQGALASSRPTSRSEGGGALSSVWSASRRRMAASKHYPRHFCQCIHFAWQLVSADGEAAAMVVDFLEFTAFSFACDLSFLLLDRLPSKVIRFVSLAPRSQRHCGSLAGLHADLAQELVGAVWSALGWLR